jgi:DNA repair photolyase
MPERVSNPPNPWVDGHVEWLGEPPDVELKVYEEQSRSILSSNESPDLPFTYSVNPYRGCFHGCAYCYARRTHEYLDFGAGTDFDRRIVVKVNAPELLRERIVRPDWERPPIIFSGVTDCYQPLEASYELTRGCLEVCASIGNPVGIVTKGALVRRDIDVLQAIDERAPVRIYVSIPFADDETGRKLEPHATTISQRFRTIEALADAGLAVGVAVAPIIPGLSDSDVPEILERAADCGADHAFYTLLRLPGAVEPVFEKRLRDAFPDRADKVFNQLRQMRGGEVNNTDFGDRMEGKGARWETTRSLFDVHCKKLGLNATDRAQVDQMSGAGSLQGDLFEGPKK